MINLIFVVGRNKFYLGAKKGPIKKHMGFYKKLKNILNPIKDASNEQPNENGN